MPQIQGACTSESSLARSVASAFCDAAPLRVARREARRRVLNIIKIHAENPRGGMVRPDRFRAGEMALFDAHLNLERVDDNGFVHISFPELDAGRAAAEAARG